MIDLCWILSQLTDNNGNILIKYLVYISKSKIFLVVWIRWWQNWQKKNAR